MKVYDPTMGKVLVELLSEETSGGGIILTAGATGDQRGKVVETAPVLRFAGGGIMEPSWKPGDVIHFRKSLKVDGPLHIVEFVDVLCVERDA